MSTEKFPLSSVKTPPTLQWRNAEGISALSYVCGHCGENISSNLGYRASTVIANVAYDRAAFIHVCHKCSQPTYFSHTGRAYPGATVARSFAHVPPDLVDAYQQICRCLGANCLEAGVMVARRLLMVLAWRLGADEGKSFQHYVDFFVQCGAISAPMKVWVDKIREVGNATNHSIPHVSIDDAKNVVRFVELILDNVFEAAGVAGVASPFSLRSDS